MYRSRRVADGRAVAIKVFDADQGAAADRHRRAAAALGGVAGVVEVLESGTLEDGRSYLVSPFAEDGSLAERIARSGALTPALVAHLGGNLASALAAAHRSGVLHRDIKPSNILMGGPDLAELGDFGAASIDDVGSASRTATDTVALTLLYAAPEVLEGATPDARSDQYSLGLTLIAAATGRHPFSYDGSATGLAPLVNRICIDGVTDEQLRGIPAGLAAVLQKATALVPDDRYADAGRLAADLDAVAEDATTAPPGAVLRSRPGRVRQPRMVVGLGVLILVAVAATMGLVLATRDDDTVVTGPTAREKKAAADVATTSTSIVSSTGPPVTEANGLLGELYLQDEFAYAGQLTRECRGDERWVALAIHAADEDRKAGVAEPWVAVGGKEAGTFMAYLPCESGGRNIRYVLRAPGRWFTVVAQFPQDQYDRMVGWMWENETSPAPDYTVDDPIRATLADRSSYLGWAIIDRAE